MKKYLFTILGTVFALLLLAGCAGGAGDFQNKTDSGNLTPMGDIQHDWGDINILGGIVPHTFEFKNHSDEPLYLKGAQTSCMCTQARFRLPGNSVSPKYGMHNNPASWSTEIKPGETFGVEVFFDPMAHGPDATGPIQRSIHIITSARDNPVMELKTLGNVLSKEDYMNKHP